MHNRIFAGLARLSLLVAAVVGLVLLPATDAGAAPVKSKPLGGTQGASPSNGVNSLAADAEEPYTLYPRSNYQWPFRSGPQYGIETESALVDEPGVVRTQVGTFDLRRGTPPDLPPELRASVGVEAGGPQYFILVPNPEEMKDGGFDRYRDSIVSLGGAFVQELGNAAYLVRLNPAAHSSIATQSATLALEPYHPAFKLAPNIGRSPLFTQADAISDIYKLILSVFPGEDPAAVAQAVRDMGGNVVRVTPIGVDADLHRAKLAQVAAIRGVSFVEERLPLVMWGAETTAVMQTGAYHATNNVPALPYHDVFVNGGGKRGVCTPSGTLCQSLADCPAADTACSGGPSQILMTVDSGIQLDDGDLSDTKAIPGVPSATHRKVRVYETTDQFGGGGDNKGCDSPTQGGFTHGHMVASTALGNATVVPFRYNPATPGVGFQKTDNNNVVRPVDGVAPRAVLVSYDANVTPLTGNCADPAASGLNVGSIYNGEGAGASLEVAYHTHGARTFNFSWGTTTNPVYGANASSIDTFLTNHLDAMLFLSAGNDGRDANGDLFPDPGSISDPATAKDAVVVGGSGNTAEPFNGANQEDRFGASSVGPANVASGRIAPLLMAPGTDFGTVGQNMGFDSEYACRSNDNDQIGSVECDVAQGASGTSFASPAAAGAAMLVRDYFVQGFYPDGTSTNPSNAADIVTALSGAEVKAILVASADWMDNSTPAVPTNAPGDNLALRFRFNREQGYGRIQLNNVLPLQTYNPTPPGLIIADGGIGGGRIDISGLSGDINTGLSETDTGTFTVCDDSKEIRVALAYIDAPGNVLSRNLDLELQAPSGKIYYGNYFTDDNDRDATTIPAEDCPNTHLTGSLTPTDNSPWSLETCANSVRDNQNPTEAVFLSPDARNDTTGVGFNADKQTESGTWTIRVRTGAGSAAATQRYAVAVTGGVCIGSSIQLDQGTYVCNQPAIITVNEKDETSDPTVSLTDHEVATRTLVQVLGTNGAVVDQEDNDHSSPIDFGITHTGTKYSSTPLTLTERTGAANCCSGNGVLDVRSGETIKVTYRDKSNGIPDAYKVRTNTAGVNCAPAVTIGGVTFGQFGLDTSQAIVGGCERDGRGLFTFGFPDHYMDDGERLTYRVAFQSSDADLTDVSVSLRCVLADSNSPADCQPGTAPTALCLDPNRSDNSACPASLMTILDSPKDIGDLPAGQVATPGFAIQVGAIAGVCNTPGDPGCPNVDMILGVSARKSGRTAETLLVTRNTLNADELSFYYSTDYPNGGSEWADWPNTNTGDNPANEQVDGVRGRHGYCANDLGIAPGHPISCDTDANCVPPTVGSCVTSPPTTQAGDFNSDYRFDLTQWSSLIVTSRNPGFSGPWNFDASRNDFLVGLNNTSSVGLAETVANWGEDKNFNGVLDWVCSTSAQTTCPGAFPNVSCGRCSNAFGTICSGNNVPCGGGGSTCNPGVCNNNPAISCPTIGVAGPCGAGTCVANGLGICQSTEDRDPQNGLLDDNWGTAGGCGWQTNGTTANPNLAGGVWHTGRIDVPAPPCLVSGAQIGACQNYETLTGVANVKHEWEMLVSPIFHKVNVCNTDAGPLPASCVSQTDTATRKVFTVEFMDWAWNMSMDLKDRWAQLRWEIDTDTDKITPIDLVNDAVVLNVLQGNQGPISGGNSPLTDGFNIFAPFAGSASQNGTVGQNRVGRNPCYFEINPQITPFHFADPLDDDIDNDTDGQVDEDVTPNGPLRNFDTAINDNPPADYRFNTLEDIYGPSGESFQTSLGFRVFEGNTTNGAAQTSYGVAVDDVVVQWREYRLTGDGTSCGQFLCVGGTNAGAPCVSAATCTGGGSCDGPCANLEVDSGNIFEGNGVLTVTVTDTSPYRCLGGPVCTPENKNDCNHDGDFTDVGINGDDSDCDNNGIDDVLVKVISGGEPGGEWVVCNKVGSSATYRGTLPVSIGGNVAGVLFITDVGGLNNDVTARYEDFWDGGPSGARCANDPDPAKQGFINQGVNLVVGDTGNVVVTAFRIDDTTAPSDSDGYPDTNELINFFVTISNKTRQNLTNLVIQASVNDPKIECLLSSRATVTSLADGASVELTPFQFKVSGTADRTTAGKTPLDDFSAAFTITIASDQIDINTTPQVISLDLDLDSTNPALSTTSFTEGFESGFGNFQFLNLDFNIANNTLSNGMRCQYNDPDFINSNSYGDTECYVGFQAGQSPVNDWHIHGSSSPDGGRSYAGTQSLHWGKHTPGSPNLDTYSLSQIDAIRTKAQVNFAARVCTALQAGQVKSCNTAADCTSPASACSSANPLFSFKQQISLIDDRGTNTPAGQSADRAVVQAQLFAPPASLGVWQKLFPFQNVYDAQGTDNFSNCLFDPTDDGNNEDSYFDPTDPNRRLGPSSTCFPEFIFGLLGDTDAAFGVTNIGRASDGPGLLGNVGTGTWVESRFDMSRYRGRAVRLRYLVTSIKVSDNPTAEAFFMWNPRPDDDGWYVDDIRITQTLGTSSPVVTNDTKNNGNTSCGAICTSFTTGPTLSANPGTSPSPGKLVTLTAAATVDRCANGLLLYQFWLDGNGNGAIDASACVGGSNPGAPCQVPNDCLGGGTCSPDIILRDYSANPIFEDSPLVTTKYVVRVKCSTATSAPCSGADAPATVTVGSPCQSSTFPWDILRVDCINGAAFCTPAQKARLKWTADPSGVEVIRGDLSALESNGGDFKPTVLQCLVDSPLANDTLGQVDDTTQPTSGQAFYYLARRAAGTAACPLDKTWSSAPASLFEKAGTGTGKRTPDLDTAPRNPNMCVAPPL